jgi:hypothetical protein
VNLAYRIADLAARQLRDGFGDVSAPLDAGEYVRARLECPHRGCDWTLVVEWRRGADVTRLRGTAETDRLAGDHLETHLDPTIAGIV